MSRGDYDWRGGGWQWAVQQVSATCVHPLSLVGSAQATGATV
jgi:hypothetical protein